MDKAEVIQLLLIIKRSYPGVDTSPVSIDLHLKYLEDMPYNQALANVEQHILKDRFPPKIADIRAGFTSEKEHQQLKTVTEEFFRKQSEWADTAAPPPAGMKEALRERLFGKR